MSRFAEILMAEVKRPWPVKLAAPTVTLETIFEAMVSTALIGEVAKRTTFKLPTFSVKASTTLFTF
jgi:hypothetical protein